MVGGMDLESNPHPTWVTFYKTSYTMGLNFLISKSIIIIYSLPGSKDCSKAQNQNYKLLNVIN